MNIRPDHASSFLDVFAEYKPVVLVFLPSTNEHQRFVLGGAFDGLGKRYQLRYVVSPADLERVRAASPHVLRPDNTELLEIPRDRYKIWTRIFELSCRIHADRSSSFALRVGQHLKKSHVETKAPFEIALARNAWRVARRLRPLLTQLPWLRSKWGMPSAAMLKQLDELFKTAANAQEMFMPQIAKQQQEQQQQQHLLNELLAEVKPYGPLVELLDRVDPLFCVIPTSLLDNYCNDLLLAAEKYDHTVLVLQSGWDNLSSKGMIHHHPQYIGVWGPQSAKHAKHIQNVDANVVLGAPHYEALVPATMRQRDEFRARIGVSPADRLMLFGGSFRQFDETAVLEELDGWIDAGKFGPEPIKVLYRPHPWRADRLQEDNFFDRQWKHVIFDPDMRDRYVRSKSQRGFLKSAPSYDMPYLALLISSVDVVISPMSTLLIESLVIDKPTMAVAFSDGKHEYNPEVSSQMTHFRELRKSGVIEWCVSPHKFKDACVRLVARSGQKNDPELRQRALDEIVLVSDATTYSSRLDHFAMTTLELVARRQRGHRIPRIRGKHSHSYHAHVLLKEYCGLPEVKEVPGYWMHGWLLPQFNVNLLLVATHKTDRSSKGHNYPAQIEDEKGTIPQWVSRKDQEEFLRSEGYKHVKAIGLPFAYLPPIDKPRIAGSLLVMPPHSHGTHAADDPLAKKYAEAIASKRKDFSEILVCLNVADYFKGEWIEAFRRVDIPVFIGAEQGDQRTLLRLKHLLSTFEYVTTNGFGSHIAYAAAAGAKMSIFGPFADHPRDAMRKAWAVRVDPSLIDVLVELHTESALRKHCPFLFVEPENAVVRTDWGRKEIGDDNRLSPADLMDLFQWPHPVSQAR